MKTNFSKWQHAVISYGMLILCLFALYILLVEPAIDARISIKDKYDNLELQLTKYRQAEQQMLAFKNQITQLDRKLPGKKYFLEEKSNALAAADLQKHLKTLIESHTGDLISIQPFDDNKTDLFPKVTIKIHMRSNTNSMQQILYQLESSTPRLFIDNVIIQQNRRTTRRRMPQDPDQLDIRFDVTGYIYNSNV